MADFYKAFSYLLPNEGGLTNDPDDSGGITNFGLIKEDLAEFQKKQISDITNQMIIDLTVNDAETIYKALYWDKMRLTEVLEQAIATAMFDIGVNRGRSIAARYAQDILDIDQDGIIGDETIDALNKADPKAFVESFSDRCVQGYQAIAKNNPRDQKFLAGWTARAKKLLTLIAGVSISYH